LPCEGWEEREEFFFFFLGVVAVVVRGGGKEGFHVYFESICESRKHSWKVRLMDGRRMYAR